MAVGLIGAVTIAKGMDLSIEISPEDAADALFELHSFCDWKMIEWKLSSIKDTLILCMNMFKKKSNVFVLQIFCLSFLKKEKKSKNLNNHLNSSKISTKIICQNKVLTYDWNT